MGATRTSSTWKDTPARRMARAAGSRAQAERFCPHCRHGAILAALMAGQPQGEIATTAGVTVSRVSKIATRFGFAGAGRSTSRSQLWGTWKRTHLPGLGA